MFHNAATLVSIHAPARGATKISRSMDLSPNPFQSTRPHGARRFPKMILARAVLFQSTRPHGARLHDKWIKECCFMFQSTRPHGARHSIVPIFFALREKFQSTRPHGARHSALFPPPYQPTVSIHAPARGATDSKRLTYTILHVSIHAPARGATFALQFHTQRIIEFQSTRPHGARPSGPSMRREKRSGFNPRARTGRDC